MKHRVVKFPKPNRCVSGQQTLTRDIPCENDDDDFTHGGTNFDNDHANQPVVASKQGSDNPKCTVSESAAESTYPRRKTEPPAHLSDYVTLVTGNDFED